MLLDKVNYTLPNFEGNLIEKEESQKRCILKEFNCFDCKKNIKKLLQITIKKIKCPFCNSDNCHEKIINEKPNKYPENLKKAKNFLASVIPFSVSPFKNSIVRHDFDINIILDDRAISTPKEEFFYDNYASNFITNFKDPMTRIVFLKTIIESNKKIKSPPLNKKDFNSVKSVILNEDYCKKLENGIDLPNCMYCLKDIKLGDSCYLLRCGHLFHKDCITIWIKDHQICPICKFDIAFKHKHKASIDIMTDEVIEERKQIEKSIKNENIFNDNDINNINIIGEKNNDIELLLND